MSKSSSQRPASPAPPASSAAGDGRADVDELNRKLREQYTEIAKLAGGLAHEIKNPLSTIRLNMELLAEEFADCESPRERRALGKIEMVQRECQRLQDLLDDFLRFARAREPRLTPTDINDELSRLLDFYQPQAVDAGMEVVRYLHPDLPSLPLDREMFQAAIMNLLLNAQQAMPQGGQLVVRTSRQGNNVVIDLIDNGCGMDEKTLAQIFQAFYSTKRGGSGLGLPTVRKIVEAHGGQVRVQSAQGRGTQFTLEFPLAATA